MLAFQNKKIPKDGDGGSSSNISILAFFVVRTVVRMLMFGNTLTAREAVAFSPPPILLHHHLHHPQKLLQLRQKHNILSSSSITTSIVRSTTSSSSCVEAVPSHHRPRNQTAELWSFVYSLQHARRQQQQQQQQADNKRSSNKNDQQRRLLCQPAYSLVQYMSTTNMVAAVENCDFVSENVHDHDRDDNNKEQTTTTTTTSALLTRALVQAIRLAASANDYKLILKLVEASIRFASSSNNSTIHNSLQNKPVVLEVLEPRIFGEAIGALAGTSVNMAKIKKIWVLLVGDDDEEEIINERGTLESSLNSSNNSKKMIKKRPPYLTASPGALELNVMLKALTSRGKVRAALDLFYQYYYYHHRGGGVRVVDSYSLTISLEALILSVETSSSSNAKTTTTTFNTTSAILPRLSLKRFRSMVSPCWQWNEALSMLDTILVTESSPKIAAQLFFNNHVISALLKLNLRAARVAHVSSPHPQQRQRARPKTTHDMVRYTESCLGWMEELGTSIALDTVTCTLLLTGLGSQWQTALALFQRIKLQNHQQLHQQQQQQQPLPKHHPTAVTTATSSKRGSKASSSSKAAAITFPKPNVYMYSAVISACAKGGQYESAVDLLEELLQLDTTNSSTNTAATNDDGDDCDCKVNTMIFNSVLQALTTTRGDSSVLVREKMKPSKRMRQEARHRVLLALQILERMESEATVNGKDTRPDTVTYNTLFAVLGGVAPVMESGDWISLRKEISRVIIGPSSWEKNNRTAEWSEDLLPQAIIERMIETGVARDVTTYRHAFGACPSFRGLRVLLNTAATSDQGSWSSSAESKTGLLTSVLPIAASLGGIDALFHVLEIMSSFGAEADSDTVAQLILSFGVCHKTSLIPLLTRALEHHGDSALCLEKEVGTGFFSPNRLPYLEPRHLEVAVKTCLRMNDVESARSIIYQMKENETRLSSLVFQEAGRLYALNALQSRITNNETRPHMDSAGSVAATNALKAYTILESITEPPMSLVAIVSKALATAGMFELALDLLGNVHEIVNTSWSLSTEVETGKALPEQRVTPLKENEARLLKSLHVSLLRSCAAWGNVTYALRFCEEIQKFALNLQEAKETSHGGTNTISSGEKDIILSSPRVDHDLSVNMQTTEWQLLLVAAMKSGHWRVCLSTLQFFQPSVEALKPALSHSKSYERRLSREYQQISSALNVAVKCLAVRSQYGWIVRVLDDWINWAGRRPPKQSVFLALRSLCARGRGVEVGSLVARCLAPIPMDPKVEGTSYEIALYVFAITSLYNEGLYDAADDVLITAVNSGSLPFDLREEYFGAAQHVTLDLHGMNVAVAHSAVRLALQQEARETLNDSSMKPVSDLIIITGRGRTSALHMRPILRPEVQRMLVEEFYPPLSSYSIPRNMGALRVPGADVHAWLDHQRQGKRSQVMAIAAILKKISSDAMRAAVTLSVTGSRETD